MQLTAANLQLAFRNSTSVRHFFFYPAIASTNDKAKELAMVGAEEGTLVIADAQSAGKGRLGRNWHSPAGLGLYVSFIFRPGVPASSASGILMAVGLGAAEAAERTRIQGVVGIKWPNDLVVEGRKLGGILIEMGVQGGVLEWCRGRHRPQRGPHRGRLPGRASRSRDLASPVLPPSRRSPGSVCSRSSSASPHGTNCFRSEGTAPLIPHWRRRSAILGRMVRVETAGQAVMGTAVGLEPDGALRVRLESGAEEILHAGDVHLVQYR